MRRLKIAGGALAVAPLMATALIVPPHAAADRGAAVGQGSRR